MGLLLPLVQTGPVISWTLPSPTHSSRAVPSRKAKWSQGPEWLLSPLVPSPAPRPAGSRCSTHLFLLLVEVVDDDTDEKIQGEERSKDDEDDEVNVHVEVVLPLGLLFILRGDQTCGQVGRSGGGLAGRGRVSEGGHQRGAVCLCVQVRAERGPNGREQGSGEWWLGADIVIGGYKDNEETRFASLLLPPGLVFSGVRLRFK